MALESSLISDPSNSDPNRDVRDRRAWYRPIEWARDDERKRLCSRHEAMNLKREIFAAWPLKEELPPDTPFGTLKSIVQRATFCEVCSLIQTAAEDVVHSDEADIIGCWIRDGQLRSEAGISQSDSGERSSLRLRIASPYLEGRYNAYQVCDIVPFIQDTPTSELFTGRAMKESQLDMSLARSWIQSCARWHGEECQHNEAWETTASGVPFIRLLDLEEYCLVEMALLPSYICLSYVWGRTPVFKTSKENVGELKMKGSLHQVASQIPLSIRDAMQVTKLVGERYLWVDSICIVQNDNADKGQQISIMGEIYRRASLTLVVAGGDNASCGIGGMGEGGRAVKQNTAHYSDELTLVQLLPDAGQAVDGSIWNTRGWTYQERLLSKRSLFFVNDTMYFQCQRAVWGEDYRAEHPRLATCAPMTDIRLSLSWEPATIYRRNEYALATRRKPYFYEYCRLVKEYTSRGMTMNSDRIPGFDAVLSTFKRVYGVSFVQGLPEEMIHESLLWHSCSKNIQRVEVFPSWSWAGWTSSVEYHDIGEFNGLPALSERWKRTRPICDLLIYDAKTQLTRPVRTCNYREPVLPERWESEELQSGETVYFQENNPDILYPIPPPIGRATHEPYISPDGLCLRTYFSKFRLTTEDRSEMVQMKGRHFMRFGIVAASPLPSNDETWLGSIRLPGFWRRKHRGNLSTPCEFIVLSEAYGFGPDELGSLAAKTWEPYDVLNVMLVRRREPDSEQKPMIVEREGVGRMLKSAWSNSVGACDILIL